MKRIRAHVVILFLLFSVCTPTAISQECGGTERWAVKDGTDTAAAQLDFANIQNATVPQLVKIKQPKIPNDNTTRVVPQEARVVRVKAHLIQWKHEDDDDYHLVLTDETEQFTPGHGRPTGHSLIGEIPNVDCLAGASGQFGDHSPLVNVSGGSGLGIANARQQIEAQFPDADFSGGWNDAGGVEVEVVGVQFFDRAHGQVGRAPNNLELHPIVSISFSLNPQELLAAAPAPARHAAALSTPGSHQAQSASALLISDPNTGETAAVTEEKALKVAVTSSGTSGVLKPGTASQDLGFPKTLTVC
jgi:hypothetical protein